MRRINHTEEARRELKIEEIKYKTIQKEYKNLIKDIFDRFPNEGVNFWNGNSKFASAQIEKMILSQKDYSNIVMNASDRFMKEVPHSKNIEKAFSLFDDYLSIFRL